MTHSPHIKAVGYALSLLVPMFPIFGFGLHFNWLSPVLVFVVLPIAGLIIGFDKSPSLSRPYLNAYMQRYLDVLPRVWVALWLVALGIGTHLIANSNGLPVSEVIGLLIGLALTSAFGTAVGHELIHRHNRLDQHLGRFIMTICSTGHLAASHMKHHLNAVTCSDHSTPRDGEGLYAFARRSTLEGIRSNHQARVSGDALGELRIDLIILVAVYGLFVTLWGWAGLLVLAAQCLFASLCFEAINYLQHYGLHREASEPFQPRHAWAHHCWLTNCLTFNLPMHSDHHAHPEKPYYALTRQSRESPRLPACYLVMFVCALVPPLWRRVMRGPLQRQQSLDGAGSSPSRIDTVPV